MPLRTKLVLLTCEATWVSEINLPIAPFPGLGIRVEVYNILNVKSVIVGDAGFDVTCIVELEDAEEGELTERKIESLGFVVGPYP